MSGMYGTGTAPKTELLINGAWTDVSTRPRAEQKIVIARGRANEQSRVAAQYCNTSLNNRDGVLSNRNPNSPYFGLLPRNTQMRVTAGAGDDYLKAVYTDSTALAGVVTADKASLDIVGDLDLRCEIQPYAWRGSVGMNLMAKYVLASNQRSWAFYMDSAGYLWLTWSTDGTAAGRLFAQSTVPVPASSGRLDLKVTLDVNNGAAGNTVAFATASAIGGTYTALGASVVQAGVTSVFSSSATLTMAGGGGDNQSMLGGNTGFGGRFFKGEVRSGLGGTLVANMDATAQTVGANTWADAVTSPNTWIRYGLTTRITTDRLRFWGELSSLPQVWDKTGRDVYVPVQASGIIRRLTQGASPLDSPMTRNFSQYAAAGYWTLEDGSDSLVAGSSVSGGKAGSLTNVALGSDNAGLPGTAKVAQFKDTTSKIQLTATRVSSTGVVSLVFYVKLSALPASNKTLATFTTSGLAAKITIGLTGTTWETAFFSADGTSLGTSSVAVTGINPTQGYVGVNVLLDTSGGNERFSIRWDSIGAFGGGVGPTSLGAGSPGIPLNATIAAAADAAFNDAKVAQVFLSTTTFDLSSDTFRKASSAWINETAAARIARLALEEAEPVEVWGVQADSEPMGYQTTDTFMNLIYDCVDTDGGMLGEARDALSLLYRTRTSLENRTDATISYTASHLSEVPLPTEDDSAFTNDVTVSRVNGGSARAVNTDGPTSVSDPPSGVGRYATAVTRNVATEDRLPSLAGWDMLVGSWDDSRYPQLTIGMHRSEIQNDSSMVTAVTNLEIGDTALLTGLPSWQPPDATPELIQGYTETLDKFLWTIVFNCTPAGPYIGAGVIGGDFSVARADATTHTIGGSLTTTATSVSLVTPAGSARWVDSTNYPAEFPFNVKVSGEVITITVITGTSSPQTATLTRSVNGIVKTHSSGELIRLATPFYVGR